MDKAKKQVEHELALIQRLGFAGYFLIVWDIIRFCKQNDILVQGRGSAANSAVCYALEITAVDPVGMELLFERFLSENRGEWPDIDLDLPSGDKREQAIQYVYQRYGELGAAMTANVITYRGKSAAREVGKALGFDWKTARPALRAWLRNWEWKRNERHHGRHTLRTPASTSSTAHCQVSRALHAHAGLAPPSGPALRRHGHLPGQLNRVVPIERASMPGRTVVQWDKEDCADLGIIKVDLLGPGHDGGDQGFARTDPAPLRPARRSGAAAAGSAGVRDTAARRYRGHVPGGEPRADGVAAAQCSRHDFTTWWCR